MDRDLFSCRNCIHNPSQGLTLGRGAGFCLQWGSVLENPERTTCKYLHRKDLPWFHVPEAIQAHTEEFAGSPGMAGLETHEPVAHSSPEGQRISQLEPTLRAVVGYHRLEGMTEPRRSDLLSMFAGSIDGRRSMMHACLVRRAIPPGRPMSSSWWEWALELLDEVDRETSLDSTGLLDTAGASDEERRTAARWEVLFTRVSGLQEFGWHASIDALKFPLQELGSYVAEQDWNGLLHALSRLKPHWRELILAADAVRMLRSLPESEPVPGRGSLNLTDRPVSEGQRGAVREGFH